MTTRITQRFEIDMAHRLMKHEGKCKNLHGHRYVILLTIEGAPADDGMIIDFGEIKAKFKAWLDSELDHGCVLQQGDPIIKALLVEGSTKLFIPNWAPSAENLAAYFHTSAELVLQRKVKSVTVYETPNCSATYEP